jgi:hypothetical protein
MFDAVDQVLPHPRAEQHAIGGNLRAQVTQPLTMRDYGLAAFPHVSLKSTWLIQGSRINSSRRRSRTVWNWV